eukprot:131611_1
MSQKHTCDEQQRVKSQNLFLKICSNILNNPEVDQYQSLNYNVVCSKLSDCYCCMQLLVKYGFYQSINNSRLIFDSSKITELQEMKNKILSGSLFNETQHKVNYDETVVQQLVDLELGSREQCIKASSKVVDYTDINEVAEQLEFEKEDDVETVQQWQCTACTLYNDMDQKCCILCYAQNPKLMNDYTMSDKYGQNMQDVNIEYHASLSDLDFSWNKSKISWNCSGVISKCDALNDLSLIMIDYINMNKTNL